MKRRKPSLTKTMLRRAYEEHGYIRVKMDKRRGQMRSGWEIRLLAERADEALALERSLDRLGLRPGCTYDKRGWFVVPLYGREQVQQFLDVVKPHTKNIVPQPPARVDMRRRRGR